MSCVPKRQELPQLRLLEVLSGVFDRQPVADLPKACFGLELRQDQEPCQSCPYQTGCRELMGRRSTTSLTGANLRYTPEALQSIDVSTSEELKLLYDECYEAVFQGEFKPDYLLKHETAEATVQAACETAKCDPVLLFLCSMHGHREANPHTRFYSSMLMGKAALNRLAKYREEVQAEYGSFDTRSLAMFAGKDFDQELTSRQMLLGEQTAGAWVAGYKLAKAGRPELAMYRQLELRLPEIWLATEPSYQVQILVPWSSKRNASPALNKHRIRTSKVIAWLKSNNQKAVSVFKARELATRQAMPYVLGQYGLQPSDLNVSDEPVVSSLALWIKVGLALQHLYCLRALQGDQQAWRRLGSAKVL